MPFTQPKDGLPGRHVKQGQIKLNLRPIEWTPKKITLACLGFASCYGVVLFALIKSGAMIPAIIITGALAFSALFIALLYWLDKASL